MQTFDAACLDCGTEARFEKSADVAVRGTFYHHCASCGIGSRPLLGDTHRFRVTRLDPDTEHPNSPGSGPDIYPGDDRR